MILLSSVLTLFRLCYTAYPQLVTFDRYSCVESLYFCPVVPCISHTDFAILSGVLRRKAIINNSRHRNNSLLQYLSLLLIIHANDVNLNPGPTHNDTVHDRDYLCGTCDRLVDWEDRGVKCLSRELPEHSHPILQPTRGYRAEYQLALHHLQ